MTLPASRMPPQLCPRCGYFLDAATHAEGRDRRPKPGDLTMCLECQAPLQFSDELNLGIVDLDELAKEDRAAATELRHLIAKTRRFKRMMQAKGEWPDRNPGPSN